MSPPTVSVVVTVYNGERFIGESLTAILSQTRPPEEVVVVDDGSTDDTPRELERFGGDIRVISQVNGGHANALNRGFREARGDYCAKCDADDIWMPEKLRRQVSSLTAHREIDVAFGGARFFGLSEGPRAPYPDAGLLDRGDLLRSLYRANSICASSTLIRRDLYERLGPFDERLGAEDYDYWMRALRAGARFYHDPSLLVRFRQHESNVSADKLKMHRAELLVHSRYAYLLDSRALARKTMARDLRNIARALSDQDRPEQARAAFVSSLRRSPSPRALAWVLLLSAPERGRRPLAAGLISLKRALYHEAVG
jgi:glycosyltransferase involved in cell wall biosynthesis